METFNFPFHTFDTEYPESGTRVQFGGNYIFTSPPSGPDLRRFSLHFETMFYFVNDETTSKNMLLHSNDYSQTVWEKANITTSLGDNMIAPDGISTAYKLSATATAATTIHQVFIADSGTTSMTLSAYIKKGTPSSNLVFVIRNHTTSVDIFFARINSDTMTISSISGTGTASIVSVGDGWYRVVVTVSSGIAPGNNVRGYFGSDGTSTTVGHSWYLWGAQMEAGTKASSFIPNTTTAQTRTSGTISPWINPRINLAALEAFYNAHKMHKTFIYPHPVYGNVGCKFYSPLKIPEGNKNGMGSVKDFTIELIEIVE